MTENNGTNTNPPQKGGGWTTTAKLVVIVAAIILMIAIIYFAVSGIIGTERTYSHDTTEDIYSGISSGGESTPQQNSTEPNSSDTTAATNNSTSSQSETTDPSIIIVTVPPPTVPSTVSTNPPINTPDTTNTTVKPNKATIFIDAGHGGNDPGTKGETGGNTYYEKDINLSVALFLEKELNARGFNVVMSRTTDKAVELSERAPMAKKANADMFVSIHCNSFTGSGRAYGPIVMYTDRPNIKYNKKSFANIFSNGFDNLKKMYPAMRASRVKSDVEMHGDDWYLAVLANVDIPSVLLEIGFMTDESDLKMMIDPSWQKALASKIADSVEQAYAKGFHN